MRPRIYGGASKQGILAALAVAAVAAGVTAASLRQMALNAAAEAGTLTSMLEADRGLARDYLAVSARELKPSEDVVEARSNDFLRAALIKFNLPVDGVEYGDPEEMASGGQSLRIHVNCDAVRLDSVLPLMSYLEANRRNWVLVSATLDVAEEDKGLWNVRLTYGAVIRARSRT